MKFIFLTFLLVACPKKPEAPDLRVVPEDFILIDEDFLDDFPEDNDTADEYWEIREEEDGEYPEQIK